jgi:DNA polymerase I
MSEINIMVTLAAEAMSDASAAILDGFRLRSGVQVFRYPERFVDEKGQPMFEQVLRLLEELEPNQGVRLRTPTCAPAHTRSVL